MELVTCTELTGTTRLAAYYWHGSCDYTEITGEGLGVYTLAVADRLGEIKSGECTSDLDRLTRWLRPDQYERAIGLYMHLTGRSWQVVSLRGYSQGEWADVIIYGDAGPDGKWVNDRHAADDLKAWFRGDLYTVAHESLETYQNAKTGETLQRWESIDSVGLVVLSDSYTLADAGRDHFGAGIFEDTPTESNTPTVEQLIEANEALGQELDRWQIIARDLIGELTIEQTAQTWVSEIETELDAMPEITNKTRRVKNEV